MMKTSSWKQECRVDYTPLEYLLVSIIDAHSVGHKSPKNRLRDAYKNLTGIEIHRVDEPDSKVSKALWCLLSLEKRYNYDYTNNPEHGGPVIETKEDEELYGERTLYRLATDVTEDEKNLLIDDAGNLKEYIYKRSIGTYNNNLIKADREGYRSSLREWNWSYNEEAEKELMQDIETISAILAKYNVPTDSKRPFWRILGKK